MSVRVFLGVGEGLVVSGSRTKCSLSACECLRDRVIVRFPLGFAGLLADFVRD